MLNAVTENKNMRNYYYNYYINDAPSLKHYYITTYMSTFKDRKIILKTCLRLFLINPLCKTRKLQKWSFVDIGEHISIPIHINGQKVTLPRSLEKRAFLEKRF